MGKTTPEKFEKKAASEVHSALKWVRAAGPYALVLVAGLVLLYFVLT